MSTFTKTKFNDKEQFANKLKDTTRAYYEGDILRAEADQIMETEKGRPVRKCIIRYFEKCGSAWKPFAFCISTLKSDLAQDFLDTCKTLKIA